MRRRKKPRWSASDPCGLISAGSNDRELPLILGLMPVLPKHAINPETFEQTSFAPLIGSGPYVVAHVDPGKSVTLKRNPDYWGRDLAINRGLWNFDEIHFDYYRDANAFHEAFKRGLFDMRTENDPGHWQTAYDFPALRDGRVVKETFTTGLPKSTFYLVFNTRRPIFSDIRVREAISLLFDFEWINHSYFFDLYRRSASFFESSELSAHGRAADARERALLAPFPGAVREDVMEGKWAPPVSDGSGRDRSTLRRALELFKAAGYELRGTQLVDKRTGRPFTFEIMVGGREEERLALLFSQGLTRAGIKLQVRAVDAVQFESRRIGFDFDMIQNRWDQSLSPGNEQSFYWSMAAADQHGSRNYMGVKSPAIDALIATLIKAKDRADVVAAVRALDRVLISGFYVIPMFHLPQQWVARWTTIEHPATTPLAGFLPESWWHAPKKLGPTVILGDPAIQPAATRVGDRVTLDDLLRRAAERRPNHTALIDPPDRESFTDGAPRRLSYAQADRMVSAIAGRLRRMGLTYRRHCRDPDGQYGRWCAHAARRPARRPDRDAAAVAVAPGGRGRSLEPRRRQRAGRERARRRDRPLRSGDEYRRRGLSDSLRLRLWAQPAGRSHFVRRSLRRRHA